MSLASNAHTRLFRSTQSLITRTRILKGSGTRKFSHSSTVNDGNSPQHLIHESEVDLSGPSAPPKGPIFNVPLSPQTPVVAPKSLSHPPSVQSSSALQRSIENRQKISEDIAKLFDIVTGRDENKRKKLTEKRARRKKRVRARKAAEAEAKTEPKADCFLPVITKAASTKPPYSRRTEGLLDSSKEPVLVDLEAPTKQNPVATLAHGLDRVLFNPGVCWLRDPRSHVYNFDPTIEIIPKVVDFAFERLTGFIKSSRDEDLWALAKKENRRFGGSTSSLSGILSHIYFMLSNNKDVDLKTLSMKFVRESTSFTPGQRMAASVVFNHNEGTYAIDSDPSKQEEAEKNILIWMGTLLEKYLTMTPDEFLAYMRTHAEKPMIDDNKASDGPLREAYRYSKSNTFVMRSQLDCHDTRLPGTGVFDIKTRACLPIRMDILNFEESSGYLIDKRFGLTGSFEREYCDLVRSGFLKYSFQARIGNMDGVFIAYHNTERIFGFQYVSLEEMDQRLFSSQTGTGAVVFKKCVEMMEIVAEEVVGCFPGQSVKCTFETEAPSNEMHVWVEPIEKSSGQMIKELVVTATSFLGDEMVKGDRAVKFAIDKSWSVHWTVTHLDVHEEIMRSRLQKAKDRQFRAYSLPSGIDHSKIEQWWTKLNFGTKGNGGSGAPSEIPHFFSTHFQEPDHRIAELRQLARKGREQTQLLEESGKGKPKIVYGVGEVYLDEDTVLKSLEEEQNVYAHVPSAEKELA